MPGRILLWVSAITRICMSGQAPLSRYSAPMNYPQRIVCLTEETTETLYAIGGADGWAGCVVWDY